MVSPKDVPIPICGCNRPKKVLCGPHTIEALREHKQCLMLAAREVDAKIKDILDVLKGGNNALVYSVDIKY